MKDKLEETVQVIADTYKKRGGLSEWDMPWVLADARAIVRALQKKRLTYVEGYNKGRLDYIESMGDS